MKITKEIADIYKVDPKFIGYEFGIRKLTPTECFRLMDVDEPYIQKLTTSGISNSQLYKMAGNSIVVSCMEKIFEQLFFPKDIEDARQLTLF